MNMEDVTHTHTHNEMLHSHKKHEIVPFATTSMDQESVILSETNQTEKEKYCRISLTCKI